MKSQQNRIELEIRPEWPQDHDFATKVTSIEQKLHKPTVSAFDEEKEEEEGLGEFSVLADNLPPNSSYSIQVICPKCYWYWTFLGVQGNPDLKLTQKFWKFWKYSSPWI